MSRPGLARPPRTPLTTPGRLEVRGRLVHDEEEMTPLHQARVEVSFVQGTREDLLARAVSDGNGRFAVHVQLPPRWQGGTVRLRVLELRAPLTAGEPLEQRWRVAARAMSSPLRSADPVDLGVLRVRWWEWRAGARLAPDPPELAEGVGLPLADRPVPALLERRLARLADPPQVDGPCLPAALLLRGVWTGPFAADGSTTLSDPLGEALEPGVILRRQALVRWIGATLRLEQVAVAAHRHLRGPSGPWLLPLLRGAAWCSAVGEHLLLRGGLDDVLGAPAGALLAAAQVASRQPPGALSALPEDHLARQAWERLRPALDQLVDRWLSAEEAATDDAGWRRFVAEMGPRGRALPAADPRAQARMVLAEVLELAVFHTAWWRGWLLHEAARPDGALRPGEPPEVGVRRRRLASGLMPDGGDPDPLQEIAQVLSAVREVEAPHGPVRIAWMCRAAP